MLNAAAIYGIFHAGLAFSQGGTVQTAPRIAPTDIGISSNAVMELSRRPMEGGDVSAEIKDTVVHLKESWRSREARLAKYDVAQAYARYYCGAGNVLFAEAKWQPGYTTVANRYLYEDTLSFECLNEKTRLKLGAPSAQKWSAKEAAAWAIPLSPTSTYSEADVKFGRVNATDSTILIQFIIYQLGTQFNAARCSSSLLPRASFIQTIPSPSGSVADIRLRIKFDCSPA